MNLNYHKMKFLRLAFYVLIAQLVLSGCAGEAVEETSSSSASEINFDAYVERNASSRAGVTDNTLFQGDKFNSGFGVFARYNHNDEILSLMDTEHVTWNKDQNQWEYEHTRYWPSEGFVDFYAFAPYNKDVKLNNPPGKAEPPYIWFPSYWNPIDLVWAKAKHQTIANNSGAKKVEFTFKHALARFGFDIKANQELLNNGAVTVKEVKLYGASEFVGVFRMAGYLNLENGTWFPDDDPDHATSWYYTWTPDGPDGEIINGQKIDGPELRISGDKLYNPNDKITNSPNSYIFIIPQEKDQYHDFYLQIKYTVGDSQQEVTVRKKLNPFKFEEGKAYAFHLILSPHPSHSRVTTNVKNWDVDVVNNVPCNQIGR